MNKLVPLCFWCLIACGGCVAQSPGDAFIFLNNYDANRPIFFFDGSTIRLAPFRTLVQVLARPVGSTATFQVLQSTGSGSLSTFATGQGQDAGLFDGGFAAVPGVREQDPAEFVIRAWRGTDTWEKALTNALVFVGQSPIFTNRTGLYHELAIPVPLENFPSFAIYPFPEACRLVPFVGARPLCMDVSANAQGLAFTWADLGTNYVYTLEFKPSLLATNWTAVAGTTWPARLNQFTLPNPPAVPSFYRVKAQVAP
jgi:hypothetical protein